jgi:hypothetical protein
MRRIHTTHTRDAALRQLQRMNRWMIAGSVVLTGVLADVAANAFPGKTVKSGTAAGAKSHGKTSGAAKTTTGVLRAPEQAPQSSSTGESAHETTPSEPAQEAAPQESAPSQEAAPEQQASERESAPAQEAAPESAPAQEAAPEESGPVVSGGS